MALTMFAAACPRTAGQGVIAAGVGPVNRSMGSAGTAAPLEAMTALQWNPGSISALTSSQVSFGFETSFPSTTLTADLPAVGMGSTESDTGAMSTPSLGWTHRLAGTPYTIGLGMYSVGRFRNRIPADPANTLVGNEPLTSDFSFFQIAPTFSYALSPEFAIGIAPTITIGQVDIDPLGPAVNVLPPGPDGTTRASGGRESWGGGVQMGLYYIRDQTLHVGLTVKSPQYLDDAQFLVPTDTPGVPSGDFGWNFDYPMIVSLGGAYSGMGGLIIATDVRYIDYANTSGFRELGFSNVFALAVGVQYRAAEALHVRLGYHFGRSPISDNEALLNLAIPMIQQHHIATGLTWALTNAIGVNLTYSATLPTSVTGRTTYPQGTLTNPPALPPPFGGAAPPDGNVTNRFLSHSLGVGVTIRY